MIFPLRFSQAGVHCIGKGKTMKFIAALNSLNTPWVAIIVIVIGMAFDLTCKVYGVPNDAATGVIGAGIGLLTGQALNNRTTVLTETTHEPAPPQA